MSKSNSYRVGQAVTWKWGDGEAEGKIEERFEREVTRTIKGSEITRKGDGDKVLKLGSELGSAG